MGIDVNAKHFAVSVISPEGKVLYQTYLGKHIWIKRKKIMERRARLQSLNAIKKLKMIRNYERNFVGTNLGQAVREIISLAVRYNADISIEKLEKFKPIGRRANKIIMRIPFYKFKQILEQRCFDYSIKLNIVDSWHTSKWCSHCGALAKGHSSNYSLFKCKECGQIVNSDRKASLAIAVKSLLERKDTTNTSNSIQISKRRVAVTQLLRPNAFGNLRSVNHNYQPMESS
jgi:IS605 OrfB family transposase